MTALTLHRPQSEDGRPLDVIELRGLKVHCIVGLFSRERHRKQPLEVDVALYLDTRGATHKGGLSRSVDYGKLAGELRFLLESGAFLLLETAADALARYILAPPTDDVHRAQVQEATVRLTKPRALGGSPVPSLTIHRAADEYAYRREEKDFGRVDVVYEDDAIGIYRLRVAPGASIQTHEHRVMDECELVMGSGLLLQGQPVAAGTGFQWPRHFAHRYDNPHATEQTILCVDRPRFTPEDEVPVPAPEGGLLPVTGVSYYPQGSAPASSEEGP